MLRLRRTRDHGRDGGLPEQAADRDRQEVDAPFAPEPLERLDPVERLVAEDLVAVRQPSALGARLTAAVLARQQAAREREVREHADPEPVADGQELCLGLPPEQRILVLRAHRPRPAVPLREAVDLLDGTRLEVRVADVTDLPFADELVERAERLFVRRDPVGTVVLVEIDVVGAQAPERRVDRLADVPARAARLCPVAHVVAELRRENDVVAPPFEHPSEQILASAAVAVDVGGVEQRHALVERRVDDRTRPFQVDTAAEVVAAEADHRHGRTALPQRAHPHGRGSYWLAPNR